MESENHQNPKSPEFYDQGYFSGETSQFVPGYESADLYQDKFIAILDQLNEVLPEGGSVLDIGCGANHLARWTKKENYPFQVTGMDFSKYILREYKNPNIERSVEAVADRLPFEDNSFNGVVLSDILEHLTFDSAEKALEGITRVLKDEGYIIIRIPNKNCPYHQPFSDPSHVWVPTPRQMKKMLEKQNFTDIELYTRGFGKISKIWEKITRKDLHLSQLGKSICIRAKLNS